MWRVLRSNDLFRFFSIEGTDFSPCRVDTDQSDIVEEIFKKFKRKGWKEKERSCNARQIYST